MSDTLFHSIFQKDNIVHIGALLYLSGFLFRNQILLRGLIILGDIVYIAYFFLAPATPLWGAIFWSGLFMVVNCWMIALIVAETKHFRLTPTERQLHDALVDVTPGQFRQLLKLAHEGTAEAPMVITEAAGQPLFRAHRRHRHRETRRPGDDRCPDLHRRNRLPARPSRHRDGYTRARLPLFPVAGGGAEEDDGGKARTLRLIACGDEPEPRDEGGAGGGVGKGAATGGGERLTWRVRQRQEKCPGRRPRAFLFRMVRAAYCVGGKAAWGWSRPTASAFMTSSLVSARATRALSLRRRANSK